MRPAATPPAGRRVPDMRAYTLFLGAMCSLFSLSAAVLLLAALVQIARQRRREATIYLGLTVLSGVVAFGFYFFRGLL